ncbi:MAG: hypothetical protein ACRENX_10895 [Candidatus Dormibacteria bacterium]
MEATQTPATAPAVDGVATLTQGYCKCSTLHLISVGGSAVGSVTFAPGAQPPIAGGTNGIYYVLGYQLMKLGVDGSTITVGTVAVAPSASGASVETAPEEGSLALAPGATEWGYLQAVSQGGSLTEQLWLGEPNHNPRLLVSSGQAAGPPSSEFPNGFAYQLLGWADGSLVLGEVPQGSDSFASSDLEVFLVNPGSGVETLVSNSQNCPIEAVAGNGEYVCFQQGGGQATELETGTAGISTGSWSLPAGSGYGAAFWDDSGQEILFDDCAGCGSSSSSADLHAQMEILDVATGAIQLVGGAGLVPDGWLPNGLIVATQYSQLTYARRGAAPLSQVVLANPGSTQVTALTDDPTSQFVGLATS